MSKTKVAILGGSGYTAGEIIKILLRHSQVQIEMITSREDRQPISASHPWLTGRIDLACEAPDPDEMVRRGVACVFSCLPHGASAESIKPILARGMRVVDLSADYRLRDPKEFEKWYGTPHHDLVNLSQAVYGLPELYAEQIKKAALVANPGCYPQTGTLGLAPLVKAGLIELDGIIVNSLSGVSGAGRTLKQSSLYCEVNENIVAYNVGKHRHTPEMEQCLFDVGQQKVQILFAPHLAPMDRGIHSTIYAKAKQALPISELLTLYRDYYRTAPFVRVRQSYPGTKDSLGSNFIDLHPSVVQDRYVIFACEDNLTRGASGVAVQNFNLMFGYDQTTGLL